MANERKTEIIVRNHFYQFLDLIEVEEQKSDNYKLSEKMLSLKTASKTGSGQGYPEFIITYKKNSDLLIIIECKAQITKHESPNKDQYSKYAVDGVLLYSSYLSKDFDVLSIAVSFFGENKIDLLPSGALIIYN
uniref:Type I restriction enzyme R protein N-terminal domain-containing protein n=1 Tax=Halimeda micronesica TaxID=170426 RepID=A0A386AXJ5_9CHLO|nr:hypothetical protein [Halimeda micronesica]